MVDLEDFKYGGTNVTAFRLLDPEREEVKQVVEDWMYGEMRFGRKLDTPNTSIKVGLNANSKAPFDCKSLCSP